jgi:CSLREA domain-containing protein
MGIGADNSRVLRWLVVLAGVVVLLSVAVSRARADVTITVNTTSDDTTSGNGTCSLREAITYANGTAEADCAAGTATGTTTITLPSGPYVLTNGELSITGPTVINGAGAASTTIDAHGASRAFSVAATTATLSNLAVTGGASGLVACTPFPTCITFARTGAPGGGIDNAGDLTLDGVTVSGNVASAGTRALIFCTAGNVCDGRSFAGGGSGGGIHSTNRLTITNSIITGNKTLAADGENGTSGTATRGGNGGNGGTSGSGGGIENDGGTLTVSNSMISGNSTGNGGNGGNGSDATASGQVGGNGGAGASAGAGGGIESTGTGSVTITNSTISGNTTGAGGNGGNGGAGAGAAGGAAGPGGNGGAGGAIDSAVASTVQNSTLTGNATGTGGTAGTPGSPSGAAAAAGTAGPGAGLDQSASGGNLVASTVASNTAAGEGGGLEIGAGGSITIENTIVASNHTGSANSNCGGPIAMYGFRGTNIFFGDNSCGTASGDPKLQPLADNGGPVRTMALAAGSSAVDVVATNDCLPSDERGVSRPQGPLCDAGAYELAAPSVSGVSASANSTTTASVTASVNPNFKDTAVSVRYGPTTAYGTTTPAQDLGSANAPTSFSARLSNLVPATTYHAQVVATNADGTTVSADVTFSTLAPVSATLASANVTANTLLVTVICDHGNPGDRCTGPITVTCHVTSARGKPVAVTSAKKKPKPAKRTTKLVAIAGSTYSVATGQRQTVKLKLNQQGHALLNARYKLPATLKLGGTTSATRKVTFAYGRVRAGVDYTWKFFRTFTLADQLTVTALPAGAKVALTCHGGGCPFAKRSFSLKRKAKSRSLTLAAKLRRAHLKPRTTVRVAITAANAVGKVVTFTMVAGSNPRVAVNCLVPGARKPSACAVP